MPQDRRKRCFVISPIGEEGSPEREHADEVFDFLIKPALDACEIDAFRSDHLHEPGKISDQMFQAILREDMCIAVLTGYNPNVFYELAIAQAAARPTVILIEKGHPLPFDIQDLRCVQYDLRLRSYAQKTHINPLIAHVRAIEQAQWTSPPLFGVEPPLGGSRGRSPEPRYSARSVERGTAEEWLKLVAAARETVNVVGTSLGIIRSGKGFSQMVVEKAQEGCQVKMLYMEKTNPLLRELIQDTPLERRFDPKVRDIDNTKAHLAELARRSPNIQVRTIRHGCPFSTATFTETTAMVIPHFYTENLRYSPLWEAEAGSHLYTLVRQDFEALWDTNQSQAGESA